MRTATSLFSYSVVLFALHGSPVAAGVAAAELPAAYAPRAAVGTVLSSGAFEVAHIAGSGSATVLSGDEIASATTSSRVMLKSGNALELAPHSRSSIFEDHALLNSGLVRVHASSAFYIASGKFVVRPTTPGTVASLETAGDSITVAVTSGAADVTSAEGASLAHMAAGNSLAFEVLPTGPAVAGRNASNTAVRLLGVLNVENGRYTVRDRYTNSIFELAGDVPSHLVNKLVMVDGTWLATRKPTLAQVDHVVEPSRIVASDATTAVPCLPDGAGGVLKAVVVDGLLSKIRNHFLVKDVKGGTYEVVGDVSDKQVGAELHGRGYVLPQRPLIQPAEKVVYLETRRFVVAASPCAGIILGSTLISTGVVVGTIANGSNANAEARHPISF